LQALSGHSAQIARDASAGHAQPLAQSLAQ